MTNNSIDHFLQVHKTFSFVVILSLNIIEFLTLCE